MWLPEIVNIQFLRLEAGSQALSNVASLGNLYITLNAKRVAIAAFGHMLIIQYDGACELRIFGQKKS